MSSFNFEISKDGRFTINGYNYYIVEGITTWKDSVKIRNFTNDPISISVLNSTLNLFLLPPGEQVKLSVPRQGFRFKYTYKTISGTLRVERPYDPCIGPYCEPPFIPRPRPPRPFPRPPKPGPRPLAK